LKAKKTLNKRQFNALSQDQQAKELKKMAKRANVRASLLEETGIQTQSYFQAQDYNFSQGRIKNRFSEGTKQYKTKADIQEAFSALTNFLNDKKSTLGGVKTEVQNKVKDLIQKGQFDHETVKGMSEKEIIYATQEASKQANKQLRRLEKEHLTKFAYEVADHYNKAKGRPNNRFYQGGKYKNIKDAIIHIQNVSNFLHSKTATPEGYKQIAIDRLNRFREKGINIPQGQEKEFYDFLSSEQFKNLGKYADSNQVIETFVDARNAGMDADMINKEFQDFMNSNKTFDEVQEILKVAKWQQGGLLH
jgi:hypothetical protein